LRRAGLDHGRAGVSRVSAPAADLWSAGPVIGAAALPVHARVGFHGGGSEGLESGEQFPEPPVVVDPGLVVVVLLGAEPPADGVPLEYSIGWVTCTVASMMDA